MRRIAVLASGSGTNLQALLDAIAGNTLDAEVVVVASDRPDAGALRRATAAGIPTVALPLLERKNPSARQAYDLLLADVLLAFQPDLVVLAGWMLIFTQAFLSRFPGRIINVHPALLPDDGGVEVSASCGPLPALRGARVVRDALARHMPVTGVTVHYVTAEVDSGPVILRHEVPVHPDDNEIRLHERIKEVEHQLLPSAVGIALEAVTTTNREGAG